jgi:hypothetical protein
MHIHEVGFPERQAKKGGRDESNLISKNTTT